MKEYSVRYVLRAIRIIHLRTKYMKKFLAIFVAPIEAYDKMLEEMSKRSSEEKNMKMEAWKDWMEQNKDSISDPGGAVGSAKRVTEGGSVADIRNTIGGYMIVQAENHDSAVKIFESTPHFGVSGGAVEVMEITEGV